MTAAQFTFLADLDLGAVQQHEVDSIAEYAGPWLRNDVPNQPIRMNGDTLERELGCIRFIDAAATWQSLKSAVASERPGLFDANETADRDFLLPIPVGVNPARAIHCACPFRLPFRK